MKTLERFFCAFMITGVFLIGCATQTNFAMDGLVPFEYFETVQKNDERLVIVTPGIKDEFEYSLLYIITNYEDMQMAQNKVGDLSDFTPNKIDNLLKEFSPVKILSTHSYGYGEGIGIFSLPPTIDKLFLFILSNTKKQPEFTIKIQ